MAKQKYGTMPEKPNQLAFCKIKGDAGTYEVWGIDWFNHRVLVFRAGENEWLSIAKVQFLAEEES
jgi:hypothetical protein